MAKQQPVVASPRSAITPQNGAAKLVRTSCTVLRIALKKSLKGMEYIWCPVSISNHSIEKKSLLPTVLRPIFSTLSHIISSIAAPKLISSASRNIRQLQNATFLQRKLAGRDELGVNACLANIVTGASREVTPTFVWKNPLVVDIDKILCA